MDAAGARRVPGPVVGLRSTARSSLYALFQNHVAAVAMKNRRLTQTSTRASNLASRFRDDVTLVRIPKRGHPPSAAGHCGTFYLTSDFVGGTGSYL